MELKKKFKHLKPLLIFIVKSTYPSFVQNVNL